MQASAPKRIFGDPSPTVRFGSKAASQLNPDTSI